jgi:cytochrome c
MGPWLLVVAVLLTSPATADEEGRRAFQAHGVDPRETHLSGPPLAGILGRRAASFPGFDYSPAMRQAGEQGLVWTEHTLDRYLADPLEAVRGTTMSFAGLRDPADRRAVIEYLARLR